MNSKWAANVARRVQNPNDLNTALNRLVEDDVPPDGKAQQIVCEFRTLLPNVREIGKRPEFRLDQVIKSICGSHVV